MIIKLKKFIIMLLMSSISFFSLGSQLENEAKAGNVTAAYQLAESYENNNNIKQAMFWYKQAAKLALQHQDNLSVIKHRTIDLEDNNQIEPTQSKVLFAAKQSQQQIISDRLAMHQNYQAPNGIFKQMDSTFGLRPYHTNYILPLTYDAKSHHDNRKHVETTFQISFKKDVFNNIFGFDETIGFAYTQRNWWQTTESSSPFRETNYLPELYVQIANNNPNSSVKGSQFGFLHESNGQGDDSGKSRSWNRLYLEGYFHYGDSYIVPRVWYKIYEDRHHDDNHDIGDYLGYGDLSIFIPYQEHLVKVLLRNNLNFNNNHGAIQIDWTYPLGDTGLFGYLQYFNGYSESLIDYNKKTNRLGIGIALSR